MRLGDDLLAAVAGVAAGRRLAAAARAAVGKLNEADRIDWSRVAIDSSHVRAFGGRKDRPKPGRPRRSGSKHHLIACGRGTPLGCLLTGGNRNDITQLLPLVDAIPPVRGRRGRPRRRPRASRRPRLPLPRRRAELRRRASRRRSPGPRASTAPGSGTKRWVVERTISWLHQYRRLRVRYERRADIHEAFLAIGCSLICLKLLEAEAHSVRRLGAPGETGRFPREGAKAGCEAPSRGDAALDQTDGEMEIDVVPDGELVDLVRAVARSGQLLGAPALDALGLGLGIDVKLCSGHRAHPFDRFYQIVRLRGRIGSPPFGGIPSIGGQRRRSPFGGEDGSTSSRAGRRRRRASGRSTRRGS